MNIKLTDIKPESNFFGLFVGENFSGKTTAAASFPKPICILDIDRRALGIKGSPWVDQDGIDIERFKGKDITAELENLVSIWEVEKSFKYKTVILDGFTALCSLILDNSFALTGKMLGRAPQPHPKIGSINIPGRDEYNYEHESIKRIMTFLKYSLSTRCNVICTAHWADAYDEDGKMAGKRVYLRPQILPKVLSHFDDVYYFEKKMIREVVPKVGPVNVEHHFVVFRNEIACTTIPKLPNEMDITGKLFYPELQRAMQTTSEVTQLEVVK